MAVNFQNDKPKLVVQTIMSLTQLKLLYEKILLAIAEEVREKKQLLACGG